jgi:hypothetical protein
LEAATAASIFAAICAASSLPGLGCRGEGWVVEMGVRRGAGQR